MKTVLHKASTRGHVNHGWLDTYHTFSFATYYNKERVHFGVLRVLNDDHVEGGGGFDNHSHDNMEIITIPLEGTLLHKDSMGNAKELSYGEVQVMSAGTGIYHSEHNKYRNKPLKFLQIWLFPDKQNVTPRYGQVSIDPSKIKNNLLQIIAPKPEKGETWVYQEAWFSIGVFDKGVKADYTIQSLNNGVYIFVIKGSFTIGSYKLDERDGIGIWDAYKITFESNSNDSTLLLMDIPMI